MDEAEFWGDTRTCPECSAYFFGQVNKIYCSIKCKNAVMGRRRRQDPVKVANDNVRKRAWSQTRQGLAQQERQKVVRLSKAERVEQAKLEQIELILEDWVWIGPFASWSPKAAAPRIGVSERRLLRILRAAREAGDPRGVIPQTSNGQRLYSAA